MEAISGNLTALQKSIFEAKSAYTIWKAIAYSRSSAVVSQALAERYVAAQKTASAFFTMTERTSLISFVVLILHPIDRDTRSFSLFNVNQEKTENFIEENKEVVEALKLVRNKVFAHKDSSADALKILIPSVEKMDKFFENLIVFYNSLTSEHTDSVTNFDYSCDDLLNEMDSLFMNLSRGESMRLKEIDIEWMWEKDPKKISRLFNSDENKSKKYDDQP